jgi:molybdate transport system substrate-binding protein
LLVKNTCLRTGLKSGRNAIHHWFWLLAIILETTLAPGEPSTTSASAAARSPVPVARDKVIVAAAADLQFAMEDLLTMFHQDHPACQAKVTYGSSGHLYAQIENGAPFDLYLSADVKYPRRLVENKKARADSLFLYAVGRLVIWAPNSSRVDVQSLGIQALRDPALRKIAIANPEHAPYGQAAIAAMKKLGVYDQVASRLVLGENVAQAAQFVETGAADIGIIALSLAVAPPMKSRGRYWEVPLDAFPRLEQGGVILSATRHPQGAQWLRDLLTSPRGQRVLRQNGFLLPEAAKP